MPDPSDEETPGSYLFPIPPNEGWFNRLSNRAQAAIRTAEFAIAAACALAAWTAGGDMTLTATALVAAWIFGSAGIATVVKESRGWTVAVVIALGVLFAIEGAFLNWHFHRRSLENPAEATPTDNIRKSLDLTVQFSCEWSQLPTVTPQHKLFELKLILGMGGAFTSFSQQPGTLINLVTPDAPTYAYRCRFSNLGAPSLVNLTAEMPLSFMESIKSGSSTRSGSVIAAYKVDTPPIVLEAGKTFDFYIRNYAPMYASMALPTVAVATIKG